MLLKLVKPEYTEAGFNAQAVGYWHTAGEHTSQRSAYVEAIAYLTKGLKVLTALPETPEWITQALLLHTMLGQAFIATQGYASPDAEHTFTRAQTLCLQSGATDQLIPILWGLRLLYLNRAEYRKSQELAQQLLTLAQHRADDTLLLYAHMALGTTLFWQGQLHDALPHLEQCLALYDPQRHHSLAFSSGQDLGVGSQSYLAWALWFLGYPDQALARSHHTVALAQQLSHPFSVVYACGIAASIHLFRREGVYAQEQAEALIARASTHGFPYWVASGTIRRGGALIAQGRVSEGRTQLQQALVARTATGSLVGQSWFLSLLAEAYLKEGQVEEGLRVVEETLAMIDATGEQNYTAEVKRLRGELLLLPPTSHQAEAEVCFHQAIDVAHSQQAKSLELRAATSLARLWHQRGKRQEAHDLLAPVYHWFTEGFDTADLQEAKALLEELGA
jgi:predicted ATPase